MSEHPLSFFILGTQKGGTSTLHYWLNQNPHLSLPKIKETHYFSQTDRYDLGLEWYFHWFVPQSKKNIWGEVDPSYLFFPETPSRIKRLCSRPKFIIILRDPLKRAYSHYLMSVQRGYESLDFVQALESEKTRLEQDNQWFSFKHHSYLTRGKYSEQIMRFKHEFLDSKFLFLRFDDLFTAESRKKVYLKLCDFIGVQPAIDAIDLETVIRQASTYKSAIIRSIYGSQTIRRIGKRLIPIINVQAKILDVLDRFNKKPVRERSPLDKGLIPNKILQNVNVEIESVAALTGLSLDHWLNNLEAE